MIATLVLAFGQASGVIWVGGDSCTDDCQNDCGSQHCPPNCPTCACAPAAKLMPTKHVPVAQPVRIMHPVDFVAREPFVSSPDPSEILHVPKPAV